jgi:hypothetical protein
MAAAIARVFVGLEETRQPARARNVLQVTGTAAAGYTAYHDCRRLAIHKDEAYTLGALAAGINNAVIAACEMFAVHSGVVGWEDRVVAFPAPSGGGKSTLTASLVKSGFSYISDEALVIADDGVVVPYPKPLALTSWSRDVLGLGSEGSERLVTPADLGGEFWEREGRVAHIFVSELSGSRAQIEPLRPSEGQAALLRFSFNHFKSPERAFRTSALVASSARVWRLAYSHPIEAAEAIAARVL